MQAVSFAEMKTMNRRLVLTLLRTDGPASRTEIAHRTGLAPSAVANVVDDLMAAGLVREEGVAPSRGGRPPKLLAFHGEDRYAVGINIGYSDTVGVVTDFGGQVLADGKLQTGPERGWPQVRAKVLGFVGQLLKEAAVDLERVRGVAVGVAGWVDSERGVSLFSPNFGWRDVPIAAEMSRELQLPVWIDNDVRMAALGEWRYGAGRGTNDFACIRVGSAVGAAFILGGRLYSGFHGTAGEIGHTVIDPDGPRCSCGKYGCLEAVVSGRAIAAAAAAELKRGRTSTLWRAVDGEVGRLTGKMVAEHAAAGDALSREVMERTGRYLGTALAMMVNIVNPEVIAVGGGVSDAGDLIMMPLHDTFKRHASGYSGELTRIVPAALGKLAGPMGAAELVVEKCLSSAQLARILD